MADLDQRGAGDLLGDQQAGHVRLLGTGLYRDILERALARARGQPVPEHWRPELVLDVSAYVPADFVPEAEARLGIYRQIAAVKTVSELEDAEEELTDRFGELPSPLVSLCELARLRLACHSLNIARVQAGPSAIALTPRKGHADVLLRLPGARESSERVILSVAEPSPPRRLHVLLDFLTPEHATHHPAVR
jgi:transcription-repair coupling factor (superfamily II helicase)